MSKDFISAAQVSNQKFFHDTKKENVEFKLQI